MYINYHLMHVVCILLRIYLTETSESQVGCQRLGHYILVTIIWNMEMISLHCVLVLMQFPQEIGKNELVVLHYSYCSQQQST